jgi:hypothetical protein
MLPAAPRPKPSQLVNVALALVGLMAMGVSGVAARRVYRSHSVYLPTKCTIVSKRLDSRESSGKRRTKTSRPMFTFTYRTAGGQFTAEGYDGIDMTTNLGSPKTTLAAYAVGGTYDCWHDPDSPGTAILTKPSKLHYLWLLAPAAYVALVLGVISWLKRQHRANQQSSTPSSSSAP